MPVNRQAFERLRILQNGAIPVTDGDLAGPVLIAVGQVHRKQERRVFATEGVAGDSPWAALSPVYAARKKLLYPSRKILVRRGEMKEKFIKTGAGYVQRYRKPFLQFGAVSRVASFHRSGTRFMPKREPVPKSKAQLVEMQRAILVWWRKRFAQVSRGAAALRQG
jgi:hypothetical protein